MPKSHPTYHLPAGIPASDGGTGACRTNAPSLPARARGPAAAGIPRRRSAMGDGAAQVIAGIGGLVGANVIAGVVGLVDDAVIAALGDVGVGHGVVAAIGQQFLRLPLG